MDEKQKKFDMMILWYDAEIDLILKCFGDYEKGIIDKMRDKVEEGMSEQFMSETIALLMSWASDAQHSLAIDNGGLDEEGSFNTDKNGVLNGFKKSLMLMKDVLDLPDRMADLDEWQRFRDEICNNY